MDSFTPEMLATLRAQHPTMELFDLDGGGQVAARRITRADWAAMCDLVEDKELDAVDLAEHGLLLCRLAPDESELDALLNQRPALADALGQRLLALAGVGAELRTTPDPDGTATVTTKIGERSLSIKVRRPSRPEWKELRRALGANWRKGAEMLFSKCAQMSESERAALADEFPALPALIGSEIANLAGAPLPSKG